MARDGRMRSQERNLSCVSGAGAFPGRWTSGLPLLSPHRELGGPSVAHFAEAPEALHPVALTGARSARPATFKGSVAAISVPGRLDRGMPHLRPTYSEFHRVISQLADAPPATPFAPFVRPNGADSRFAQRRSPLPAGDTK